MTTRTFRLLVLGVALVLAASFTSGQTTATRQVMREKLVHAERILEAVMKSDFPLLERESEALSRMPELAGWMVLNTPEYVRYSRAFVGAVEDLRQAGVDHDLDAAALRYTSVTMACYQCHRYVKSTRLASGNFTLKR